MMERKERTIFYSLIVLVGTAIILLGGFAIINYEDFLHRSGVLFPNSESSVEVYDYDRALQDSVNRLPRCAATCIFNKISDLGCAHSDYVCMCEKIQVLGDPCIPQGPTQIDFKTCMESCKTEDQWHSPGVILDICQAVSVRAVLPDFMQHNFRLYGRQGSSFLGDEPTSISNETSVYRTYTYTSTIASDSTADVSTDYDGGYYKTVWVLEPYSPTGAQTATAGSASSTSSSGSGSTSGGSGSSTDSGSGSDSGSSLSGGGTGRRKGGFSSAGKIAVGIVIPALLILVLLAFRWCQLRRKKAQLGENAVAGTDAENNNTTPAVAELGSRSHPPPAYQHPSTTDYKKDNVETVQVATPERAYIEEPSPRFGGAQELSGNQNSTSGIMSATGGVSPHHDRHELASVSTSHTELPNIPPQTYSPSIGRKPVSPGGTQSTSPPWDRSQGSDYMLYHTPEVSGSVIPTGANSNAVDSELRAMEEEMARIKAQKERLNALHALEEREEQLRRNIEARRGG